MPLEDALQLMAKDFHVFTGRPGPPPSFPTPGAAKPPLAGPSTVGHQSYGNSLPEDVAYLLRTILSENGPQFLSLAQIDLLIEYFQRHRNRLTAGRPTNVKTDEIEKQKATLLDNPHVQAALSSLIQITSLTSKTGTTSLTSSNLNQTQNNGTVGQTRRHPLFGTEIAPKPEILPVPPPLPPLPAPTQSTPMSGLVGYPPPQSYSQYYQYR